MPASAFLGAKGFEPWNVRRLPDCKADYIDRATISRRATSITQSAIPTQTRSTSLPAVAFLVFAAEWVRQTQHRGQQLWILPGCVGGERAQPLAIHVAIPLLWKQREAHSRAIR